eukprot:5380900-Prymnesium_polylepis.1
MGSGETNVHARVCETEGARGPGRDSRGGVCTRRREPLFAICIREELSMHAVRGGGGGDWSWVVVVVAMVVVVMVVVMVESGSQKVQRECEKL